MGLSQNVYLEPYIKMPIKYTDEEESIRVCEKHGEVDKSDNFCKECGRPIVAIGSRWKRRLLYSDITEEQYLWSFTQGKYMFLLNNTGKFHRPQPNRVLPLSKKDIDAQITEFKKLHQVDIEFLESKFNIKLEINFGLLYHVV